MYKALIILKINIFFSFKFGDIIHLLDTQVISDELFDQEVSIRFFFNLCEQLFLFHFFS